MRMVKYTSFFRLRFIMGLQYRVAALAGMVTQFAWGFMEIMVFRAFYRADAAAFPMTFEQTVSYIWLQQAFLAFFMAGLMENEIFDAILNGGVAYELCRPADIYWMWFSRSTANRMSKAVLRCFPVLLVACVLPEPFGMAAPVSPAAFFWFLVTLFLGLLVTVAFCMLIYMLAFYTVSAQGLRMLSITLVDFCSGAVIPLPFFPDKVARFLNLLPFAAMQNVPLRIYGGGLSGREMLSAVGLQLFWLFVLVLTGKLLYRSVKNRITVQGG